jgi:cell volume regulation protein A
MHDIRSFGLLLGFGGLIVLTALTSSRVSERIRIPSPALFLIAAAAVAEVPGVGQPSYRLVSRIVTVALVVVLLDGGMGIGRRRARAAQWEISLLGIVSTLITAAGVAIAAHLAFGYDAYICALLGAAIAPTDPAVVFSVLGTHDLTGRSTTILKGESGANDPVAIALMTSIIAAGGVNDGAIGHVAGDFAAQLAVGAAVGLAGGWALLGFVRTVRLPGSGLYPLRIVAAAFALYGVATVCHGSGFLAVFVLGILLGDEDMPHQAEVRIFLDATASLAEIVAFVVLGVSVHLSVVARTDVWGPGLALAAITAVIVRPVAVQPLLAALRVPVNDRRFVVFAGLKGAVPILLGTLMFGAGLDDPQRYYSIVVVVVAASVVVQGSLVPAVARRLGLTNGVGQG